METRLTLRTKRLKLAAKKPRLIPLNLRVYRLLKAGKQKCFEPKLLCENGAV
jgi:hypothetical protein